MWCNLILATTALAYSMQVVGITYAHGDPIDLLANTETNQLFTLSSTSPGIFLPETTKLESALPGIGVQFDSNGIAVGAEIRLDITQPLLYWDGVQVTKTSDVLQMMSPDGGQTFTVDSRSSHQSGMLLGIYDGTFSWEADPTYRLDSPNPAAGVFGIAAKVTSPAYEPSTPFLIPLIYDPRNTWDGAQISAGIALLRDAVIVAGSGDFDADDDIDGNDFLAWQRGFGTISLTTLPSNGDADLDSDVDAKDLAFWQQQYGHTTATLPIQPVPEPITIWLLATTTLSLFGRSRRIIRT